MHLIDVLNCAELNFKGKRFDPDEVKCCTLIARAILSLPCPAMSIVIAKAII